MYYKPGQHPFNPKPVSLLPDQVQPPARYYVLGQPRLHGGLRAVTGSPHGAPAPQEAPVLAGPALETPAPARPSRCPARPEAPPDGPGSRPARPGPASPRPGRPAGSAPCVRAARPRQWPKNLLVLAAPVAGRDAGAAGRRRLRAGRAGRVHRRVQRGVLRQRRGRRRARPPASGQAAPAHRLRRRSRPRTPWRWPSWLPGRGRQLGLLDRRARPDRDHRRSTWSSRSPTRWRSSTCRWSSWPAWRPASCCAPSAGRRPPMSRRRAGS